MIAPALKIILPEHKPCEFHKDELPQGIDEILWSSYKDQIWFDTPSIKNAHRWVLRNEGWVGQIPLRDDLIIELSPKGPLRNLFGMLELAYRLDSFKFLDGLVECSSLDEFYNRLATVLAKNILNRARKGLHREYVSRTEILSCVRGKIDIPTMIRQPWAVNLQCEYDSHTANIQDNQILTWTLSRIAYSGSCNEETRSLIRKAYRVLSGVTEQLPCKSSDCLKRLYSRLNADYEPLHALCRFFLEHSGPSLGDCDHTMLPFLVNMPRLYEQFVAEWLEIHLPPSLKLKVQEKVQIDAANSICFEMDLFLVDAETHAPLMVLDTKYKAHEVPKTSDIQQVVAYATSVGCKEAVLVYPFRQSSWLDTMVGDVRVRSLCFSIEDDLENAGLQFLKEVQGSFDWVE